MLFDKKHVSTTFITLISLTTQSYILFKALLPWELHWFNWHHLRNSWWNWLLWVHTSKSRFHQLVYWEWLPATAQGNCNNHKSICHYQLLTNTVWFKFSFLRHWVFTANIFTCIDNALYYVELAPDKMAPAYVSSVSHLCHQQGIFAHRVPAHLI